MLLLWLTDVSNTTLVKVKCEAIEEVIGYTDFKYNTC